MSINQEYNPEHEPTQCLGGLIVNTKDVERKRDSFIVRVEDAENLIEHLTAYVAKCKELGFYK